MPNLSVRNRSPELMDDPACPVHELAPVLRDLGRLNALSLSAPALTREVYSLLKPGTRAVRILDLGTGGGDVLCQVTKALQNRGLEVRATGVDMNPHAVEFASRRADALGIDARFLAASALEAVRAEKFDVVISSLFLHHLSPDELIELFSAVKENAEVGLVMSDLNRSWFGYCLTWAATHLLSRSQIIRSDGLTSVRAAMRARELRQLAEQAGLIGCTVRRIFPARILMKWSVSC